MNNHLVRVLIIEDDPGLLEAYVTRLSASDYDIDAAQEIDEAQQLLDMNEYAVILTDLKLHTSEEGGLEILRKVKKVKPDTQVIIFSGVGDSQSAMRSLQLKADGYLVKPLDFSRVRETIISSISIYHWQKSLRGDKVVSRISSTGRLEIQTPEPFYYYSEPMIALVRRATRLYRTSENILITGEAGTGKSLLAEGIHRGSGRTTFELVNCGGLSDITLEPMLFGQVTEDGAYQVGLLERLQGGTLILDRITGIGRALQERLLDALTHKKFKPAPGFDSIDLNVRIIAIDEGYLKDDVDQNLFLPELYKLLSRAHLHIPALRERYDNSYRDAVILAQQFLTQKYNSQVRLDVETEYIIEQYPFPGNVAELDRIIRQALGKTSSDDVIMPHHLPERMQRYGVKVGLGKVEPGIRVLCPHGTFHCDRVEIVATAHRSFRGVYLRLLDNLPSSIHQELGEQIRQFGMRALYNEQIRNAKTIMCSTCVPVQSSHFAIVDISQADPDTLYDVGLLHALGIPTLLLSQSQSNYSLRLSNSRIFEVRPNFWTETIRSRKTERNGEKIAYGKAKATDIQRRVQVCNGAGSIKRRKERSANLSGARDQ